MIFTESAPLGRFSHRVAVSVRPCVRVRRVPAPHKKNVDTSVIFLLTAKKEEKKRKKINPSSKKML